MALTNENLSFSKCFAILLNMKPYSLLLLFLITCCSAFGQAKNPFKSIQYYQRTGTFVIHVSNHMFHKDKPVTVPVSFNPEVTIFRNLTLGPLFSYFQFKNASAEGPNATRWTGSHIRYHQFLAGVKSNYHLNPMFERIFERPIPNEIIDIYLSAWTGYSFVMVKDSDADADLVNSNKKIRGGVGLGFRSMIFPFLGVSLEGGYSSFGYASFGLTFVVN